MIEPTTLPCGCFLNPVVVDGANELHVSPCRPECPSLLALIAEAVEQAKPVELRKAP